MIVHYAPDGPVQGSRVAITGVGVVAAAGIGSAAFWDGLCAPQPVGDRCVLDFDPSPWMTAKEAHRADRFTQFAVAAASMALETAGAPEGAGLEDVTVSNDRPISVVAQEVMTFLGWL